MTRLILFAIAAALVWAWLLTWAIKTFSIPEEREEEEKGTGSQREP